MQHTIHIHFEKECGPIRPMHATNNGPINGIGFGGQNCNGFELWKQAGIPYVRTHDSSFCSNYGGEHTVDIHAVFPHFEADVNDPASYDFAVTDHYLQQIQNSGSQVFYRLGSKIEHEIKKYHTLPPADFAKWAQICEHVILHYTEGWANGFYYDMVYWEIWNEPDLDPEDAENKRTWGGTVQEFYEFYKIVATHLKARFPHLKIGGPASAYREEWIDGFLKYIHTHHVPLDFFSWHCYGTAPQKMYQRSEFIRRKLNAYGYSQTESILNEWNYVKSWDQFIYSLGHILSIKGAAFTAACMCGCQTNTDIDMLMYYDARPSHYNGLFDFYTNAPLKGYYPFRMFDTLYRLGTACECRVDGENIYACAAKNETERAIMICYYTDDDTCTEACDLRLDVCGETQRYDMFLLDGDHNADRVGVVEPDANIRLMPNTVCLLKATT